jgi:site-specific recombinase XerD
LEKEEGFMDFQISSQQRLGVQLQGFLDVLKEKGYAESTLAGYKPFIGKAWDYISQKNPPHSLEASQNFILRTVPEPPYSDSGRKRMRTSIRRFNGCLSNQPHAFRRAAGRGEPPDAFKPALEGYIPFMAIKGLKPAAIEAGRIFAAQFLNSIFVQGALAIKETAGVHAGAAVLPAGAMEGVRQKPPRFLKRLKEKGPAELSLGLSVPHIIERKALPSIYSGDEPLQIPAGIGRGAPSGKRNCAIMPILAAYGLRAKDLAGLETGSISFQHRLIPLKQSKTGRLYQAALLPSVQAALEDYPADASPSLEGKPVFWSVQAALPLAARPIRLPGRFSGVWIRMPPGDAPPLTSGV